MSTYRSFATRVSRLKILAFLSYCNIKKTFADALFKRYSGVMQFAKLAAGEQVCRHCTHGKL